MTILSTARRRYAIGLSFACFIALGMVNSLLGVAWPSMRQSFGLPLDALAALLVTTTIGFVAGSVLAGQAMSLLGIGRFLLLSNMLAAAGLLGYSLAPGWWVLVALGLAAGWASGAIDTGLNIYVAVTRTVRIMNWMHASFGIGATIGPLLMTVIVGSGLSWRLGYAFAAFVHFVLGLLFLPITSKMNFRGAHLNEAARTQEASKPDSPAVTLRVPVVIMSVMLFLLYTGVESTAGQWAYTFFTEARTVSTYLAGVITSIFWGMLTIGRIIFGAAADRIGIGRLLRVSMAGVVLSAALLLVRSTVAGFVSIALMGLALAAIFPTLTSDTPYRAGSRHAANAIGLQTGAASVGFALLPGLAGYLAARLGLEVLGPFLLVTAMMMMLTNELVLLLVRRRRLREEPAAPPSWRG